MTYPIRYAQPPTLQYENPTCSDCCVDVDHDGNGWVCPTCGTTWDTNGGYDEPGNLHETWPLDDPDERPVTPNEDGWRIASEIQRKENKARVAEILAKR